MTDAVRTVLTGRRVEPLWKHCLVAFPLATLPALALVGAVYSVVHLVTGDVSAYAQPPPTLSALSVLGSVLLAPLGETLLMAVTLPILHAITRRVVVTAVLSAALWGLFHALHAPLWFVGPAWGFFVLSASYLAWREVSFGSAFAVACVPHALNNAAAVLLVHLFTA